MTQPEYEQKKRECWEEFCRHIVDEQEEFYNMFDRAYALGKQEKDADTVIQGWVARNKGSRWHDHDLHIFVEKPGKYLQRERWIGLGFDKLPITAFPDLTWESEPEPVEIIIKRKKNG